LRRWEWREQIKLAGLLDRWLPDDAFATAFDPVAGNALSGWVRRRRGVKPGCPDNWVLSGGRLVTIELKTPGARLSTSQREARARLVQSGSRWWLCLTAQAAMWALWKSGVKFREIELADGTVARWRRPRLEPWEKPRQDPSDPRPMHPQVLAQRREARRRWREQKQALKAASREDAGQASEAA
jgi:hypothetical protein